VSTLCYYYTRCFPSQQKSSHAKINIPTTHIFKIFLFYSSERVSNTYGRLFQKHPVAITIIFISFLSPYTTISCQISTHSPHFNRFPTFQCIPHTSTHSPHFNRFTTFQYIPHISIHSPHFNTFPTFQYMPHISIHAPHFNTFPTLQYMPHISKHSPHFKTFPTFLFTFLQAASNKLETFP
jgi:hypothetical protein